MGSLRDGAMVRAIWYEEQIGLCSCQGPFRRKKTGDDVELQPIFGMISRAAKSALASTNPVSLDWFDVAPIDLNSDTAHERIIQASKFPDLYPFSPGRQNDG